MFNRAAFTPSVVDFLSRFSPEYSQKAGRFLNDNFDALGSANPAMADELYELLLIGAAGGAGVHLGDVLNGTDPGELATNAALTALPVGGAVGGYMLGTHNQPDFDTKIQELKKAMPQAMREGRHAEVQKEFADFKNQGKNKYNSRRISRGALGTALGGLLGAAAQSSLMRDE